jgi:dihydroorotate dehydrogenase (fumarate)
MELSSKIQNITFPSCILNASGPRCSLEEELLLIDNSFAGGVVTKTTTLELREGNPKPRYYDNLLGSINSMGLPNQGHNYYIKVSDKIIKPYIISMTGMTLVETITILTNILVSIKNFNKKITGIEINLSCPNIVGKGQLAYDFKSLDTYLNEIIHIYDSLMYNFDTKPLLGIKLPPYFELSHFEEVSKIISKYPINFITCINSIGNGLIINYETETTVIKPKEGIGGIGGSYIKPTGLSNVRNFYLQFQKLNKDIKIIGCGGIETGKDAFEYILCGADLLQIGTQFYKENISCFKRILKELEMIMKKKNYSNIQEFKGKLKTI